MNSPGFINPKRSPGNGPSLPISAIHPHLSTYHEQPFQSHGPLHFHGHHTRYTGVSEAPPRDTGGMNSHEFRGSASSYSPIGCDMSSDEDYDLVFHYLNNNSEPEGPAEGPSRPRGLAWI